MLRMTQLFQHILHGESDELLAQLNPKNINLQDNGSSLLMYALQHKQDKIV